MAYIPPTSEPIAIIGSACRFPGNSTSPAKLWELLSNPRDLSREIPPERFNVQGFYHPDAEHNGTTNAPKAYFLEQDLRQFDATFFNITPKEAEAIDPQGKILLETVYEGMESAGISLQESMGKRIAVFVGTMTADYEQLTNKDELTYSQYCATGTSRAIISNRVSYFFHWNGPSMTIDTACSSSLVALHQAVLSLRSGESSMACVAGTNIILAPELFICESNLHMLSPNGKSRMWDEGADGYARGEGVAVLFVKTLSQALADGDHIECIVRETGVNSDGRTKGITMPSATAQAALIRDTYARSGLDTHNPHHQCQYFEAHGTGTQAGDPTEAEAIYTAFFGEANKDIQEEHSMLVGSVKTIIGHTEGAAGVAGIIKAMLAMQHQVIPPNQHMAVLNPRIAPFAARLKVPTVPLPWPRVPTGHPLRASVNSFGFGGTNAHAILERYEPAIHGRGRVELDVTIGSSERSLIPLLLSANSEKALVRLVRKFTDYLSTETHVNLAALAWTMAARRSVLPHRVSFSVTAGLDVLVKEMQSQLNAAEGGQAEMGIRAKPTDRPNRILGVFTGQGAQWPEMGKQLLQVSPLFQQTIRDLNEALITCPNPPAWSIESELLAAGPSSRLGEAAISQPLCTAVQIALVNLLRAAGITFAAVVGHSSGEIAAAYAAGVLTAREAILIAYYRGYHAKLASGAQGEKGGMIAVGMGVEEAMDLCDQAAFRGRLYIAASNAPASVTLSGDLDAVQEAKSLLDEQGRFARVLKVDTAYHSHHMDRCAVPYHESLSECGIRGSPAESYGGSCVWVSSVYGPAGKPTPNELKGRYWRNNMVQPVLFAEALRRVLADEGPFDLAVEVGPHPALKGPALQTMQEAIGKPLPYIGLLNRGQDDVAALSGALGTAWTVLGSSSPVRWEPFAAALGVHLPSVQRVIKDLPSYSWDHLQPLYRQPRMQKQYVQRRAPPHELLGVRTLDDTDSEHRWRNILKPDSLPWLRDHRFQGQVIVPAAAYCVMAVDAALAMAPSGSIRLVEVHDIRIQAGISMADDTQGVETLFSLTRTIHYSKTTAWSASFTLEWAPVDNTMPMKTAVTGTVRVEMGDSSADVLPKRAVKHSDLHTVNIDEFYSSMQDIGLGYTGPFRALISLKRRLDTAHGVLQKPHEEDLSKLAVRPALLDASFQTAFAAFAAPGDGAIWTSFLPQHIRRLRFNPMLCTTQPDRQELLDLDATITNFSPASPGSHANFTGNICVYNKQGQMEIQVEGITVASFAASAENDRDLYLETVYKVDPWSRLTKADDQASSIMDNELLLSQVGTGDVTHIEGILSQMNVSLSGQDRDLLCVCAEQMPSLVPALVKEITRDSSEQSSLRHQLTHVVDQVSHRFPRLRILEMDLSRTGALGAHFAGSLAVSFVSYTYIYPDGVVLPRLDTGELRRQPQKIRVKQLLSGQSLTDVDLEEESYDLVIVAGLSDDQQVLHRQLGEIRHIMTLGGYLLIVRTARVSLQERLLHCVSPDTAIVSKDVNTLGHGGLLETVQFTRVTSEFHTPRRTSSLHVAQATNASLEAFRSPLTSTLPIDMPGPILLLGGSKPETSQIISRLEDILPLYDCVVITAQSLDAVDDSVLNSASAAVMLSDLDEPLMASMTETRLAKLQQLFAPNRSILWLTRGFREDNPYHYATLGLSRSVRLETPGLRLQFLDVDTLSGIEDLVAEVFLRLLRTDDTELAGALWSTEYELVLQDGQLLIPRVLPMKDLNRRYNSVRRVIAHDVDVSRSVVEIVAARESTGVVWHANDTGVPVAGLQPRDPTIVVRMRYSSAWALDTGEGVFAFVGIGDTRDWRQVLVVSATNASCVCVHRDWTFDVGLDRRRGPSLLARLLAVFIAKAIRRQTPHGMVTLYEPTRALMDVLDATEGQCRYLTSDAQKAARDDRLLFVHPLLTDDMLRSVLPVSGTFVSFENDGVHLRLKELLPSSVVQLDKDCLVRLSSSCGLAENTGIKQAVSLAIQSLEPVADDAQEDNLVSLDTVLENRAHSMFTTLDWVGRPKALVRAQAISAASALSAHKTYVLVGLTGELGQSLCRFMIRHGARFIVVASRNPNVATSWIEELVSMGATVQIMKLDVTDLAGVHRFKVDLAARLPPVGGVVNGAMILSDGIFADMTIDEFTKVMRPKVTGSTNLDLVFNDPDLDFFIMFSSLTGVAGNRAQSNYTAANMYMAGLAAQRRKRGLAASVLDIGMLYGIGYINRTDGAEIYRNLRRQGYRPISERDIHGMFIEAMVAGRPGSGTSVQLTTGLHRFGRPGEELLPWHVDPRFSHYMAVDSSGASKAAASGGSQSVQELLLGSQSLDEIAHTLRNSFAAQLESMLQLAPGTVNTDSPIIDLGVDSLVAVEVRSWFLKNVEKDMPVLKVLGGGSIASLSDEIAAQIFAERALSSKPVEASASDTQSLHGSSTDPSSRSDTALPVSSSNTSDTVEDNSGDWGDIPSFEQIEPMSYSQARMWFPRLMLEDKTAYNCTTAYRLRGALDIPRFEQALHLVLRKHQVFRTWFFVDGSSGEPLQAVTRYPTFALRTVLKANDDEDVDKERERIAKHVFDLEHGDGFVASLLVHSDDYYTVIFGYHHILLDGVSWQLFLQDLEKFYMAPARMTPNATDFIDFAVAQRSDLFSPDMLKRREFWRSTFADGLPPSIPLFPFAKVTARRPLERYEVSEHFIELDRSLVARIKAVSADTKATSFHVYLAVFQVMLHRILKSDNICIGLTDANRNAANHMNTVGLLLDTLPLRLRQSASIQTFQEQVQSTRNAVYEALGQSGVPLDVILREIGCESSPTEPPLFQVLVNYRMGAVRQKTLGDIQLDFLSNEDARHPFDFILTIDEDEGRGGLTLSVQDYIYDKTGADIILQTYIHLLEALVSTPGTALQEPSIYPPGLVTEALRHSQGDSVSDPWAEETLSHRVDAMARSYPSSTAVKDGSVAWTYEQLARRVARIASSLMDHGAAQGSPVAVFCERSADMIACLLAILRIGAVYVPCDVRNSDDRLSSIVRDSAAALLVCDRGTAARVPRLGLDQNLLPRGILNVSLVGEQPISDVRNYASRHNLAFIMFTSGSTGKPKGIKLTHANFMTHVAAATARMQLGREVILQQSALGYDASLAQIFYALANGGSLVISSNRAEIHELASVMLRERVTFTLMSPSEYTVLLEYGTGILSRCRDWRVAMCGGEAFLPRLKESFRGPNLQSLQVFNAYGPTEISVASNIALVDYRHDAAGGAAPIGTALPNYSVYLVDEETRPVPLGWPGQIAVGGPAVSMGYLHDDHLTRERFIFNGALSDGAVHLTGDLARMLPDGSLVYQGRIESNTQIKLRGIRIQLDDIATTIVQSSAGVVANAAVGTRGSGESQFLVAYVVFAAERQPQDVESYATQLLANLPLPQYMKPAMVVPVDALPLTASGKLDFRALNDIPLRHGTESQTNESGSGWTENERRLKKVWESVLGQTGIAITRTTDFFSAGGNSLLLIKLQALIEKEFNTRLRLPDLFRSSSLQAMAARLDRGATSPVQETQPPEPTEEDHSRHDTDWEMETALPAELLAGQIATATPHIRRRRQPLTVILTGATGFLGRAIVHDLQARDEILQIHCVAVRDVHSPAARALDRSCDKVILHAGDLSRPYLGMLEDEARLLFEEADVIVHNGADVSFLKAYESLRAPNLHSTRELIRLTAHRSVPFHFVSTAGVAILTGEKEVREGSLAAYRPQLSAVDGYVASKWASEYFLEKAFNHTGLPIRIYRPSSITGAGAPALDVMHNVLKLSREIRAVPDLQGWEGFFDFIAVEAVARSLVDSVLSLDTTDRHRTLDFVHLSGQRVVPVAKAKEYLESQTGYAFRVLPMHEWTKKAVAAGLPELVAVYLESMQGKPVHFPRLLSRIRF
ncbi:hypothetical protein CFD26_101962 [Aspergillus turcosus]|uniref:Carrier domain-containing protein n=1 Tax=Aspergillus turcosus TaxID=1245748 RepID=A0A421CV80_9EURO|nr:hypothetical protein CFD26_101962 [Aspergillus turcosus]